ncbi:MAG TPA: hypothetical protein VLM92_16185 [Romboutsia sp.]|nr:hypothetical protein [Romboutsia sp.]
MWPTVVNAIIIGSVVLHLFFGQFVVITIIEVHLFKMFNNKYSKLLKDIS